MSRLDTPAAVNGESSAEESGEGGDVAATAFALRFADASEFETLHKFRAQVFRDELRIQDPDYQDVFNDHFSKNVILTRGGRVDGAVRLAYSGEADLFFISYLTVRDHRRDRADVGLLLGAIFYLMRENGITRVCGHSTAENLPMYVGVGCRPSGPPFRKYGFTCEWTPLIYELGRNKAIEDRLVDRVQRLLPAAQARWEFTPRIVPCANLHQLAEAFERLLAASPILGTIPHLGLPAPTLTALPHLRGLETLGIEQVSQGQGRDFEHHCSRLDPARRLFARRDSPFATLARLYGVLHGCQVVWVDRWEDARCNPGVRTGLVLTHEGDRAAAEAFVARCSPQLAWTVISAAMPEAMSAKLLERYLRSLGPSARCHSA